MIAPGPTAVGNWQLVELLGEGRWCKVYRARPAMCGTDAPADYAVKLAKLPAVSDELAIRLLQREALVARDVSHPHLTSILSARVHRPPHYLVMPHLNGQSLEAVLARRERLPVHQAAEIALQAAEAMSALHQQGWIHSDIKPGNIFAGATGHVTLLDLGLARRSGGAGDGPALAGTLAYTPPESFSSLAELGPAMDVYGLGVTLYRMVTGVLPFPQTDPAALAAAHLHHPPPNPRLANPALGDQLVHLLDAMLDKCPDRRPPIDVLVGMLVELATAPADQRVAA